MPIIRCALTSLLVCGSVMVFSAAVGAQEEAAAPVTTPSAAPATAPAATPIQIPGGVVIGPDGKPVVPPGRPPRPGEGKPGETPPGGQPGQPGDAKPADGAKPAEPQTVTRATKPPAAANPDELKVQPDADGMLRFSFQNQPWTGVLEWLASVSAMSLDWQELPGDYLNLTTQRAYSVREARDLINRHLLARGYTLLENGEVLSVMNISKINPALVPRVEPEDLEQRLPHDFVKVSFKLDWLIATNAVKELEPMRSPNGKLHALATTNRIEAMDAVANLIEIRDLLVQEQSDTGQERLIEEFVLKHARATDVLEALKTLLGMESKEPQGPVSPEQMQMMQQQQQQRMMMEQQRRAQGGQPAAAEEAEEGSVTLVINPRKNSIVAHAPPDKMAVIGQAVKALDVESLHGDSLLAKPFQMQIYRLHSISPAPLVKTLQEVGDLDPNTRLEVDEKTKSIIVHGSLVDHATIRQLIDRLDASGRQFEVLPLRRLAADYVAGTIEFMMIGQEKKEERPRYFDFYSSRYGQEETKADDDKFRVDADVENNMLLLWANEHEIESVRMLLVKLGEIPPEGGRQSRMRVLDELPAEDAAEFLDRLRRAWPSLAPNPLNLPEAPKSKAPEEPAERSVAEPPAKEARHESASAEREHLVGLFDDPLPLAAPASETQPAAEAPEQPAAEQPPAPAAPADPKAPEAPTNPAREELRRMLLDERQVPAGPPPPVNVTIGPDGRLVITSQDTAALDMLEELISQLAPPAPDYKIFHLKYADAFYVTENLEEYFTEKEDEDQNTQRRFYYYDYPPPTETESRFRLSRRKKLKFIYDYDSNSILVQGADSQQLATIKQLIDIYDQPEAPDSQSARLSAVFPVKYSRAQVIAEAIKEVYRDLLSSNDKALEQHKNPEQEKHAPGGMTYIFNEGEAGSGQPPERTHVNFKGKLSIGIDPVSNTLLVSAEGENLMQNVTRMIEDLDKAAQPVASVSVVQLSGNVNAQKVRQVLSSLLAESQAATQQPQQPPAGQEQPQQPGAEQSAPASGGSPAMGRRR